MFGLIEATARMRFFTNNNADDRIWIFLLFALGYIVLVELISARRDRARAALGGRPMSGIASSSTPRVRGRRAAPDLQRRRPGRCSLGFLALRGLAARRQGQFEYDLWEPFLTPDYIQVLLVDGLLKTLQMAFTSVIVAVVFGAGVRRRQALRPPLGALAVLAGRGVLPGRARCCC